VREASDPDRGGFAMNEAAADTDKRHLWNLDPDFVFLNHGSFGAMPKAIIEKQHQLRLRIESQPVRHFQREIDSLLAASRERLARLVNADPEGLVFVPNATTGVNTVLRSLALRPGDEIIITNHIYNACRNAVQLVARQSGAKVITVHVPFPVRSKNEVMDLVMGRVTGRTRFVLIDHITSPTALLFPVEEIVREMSSRGIDVMVDGAHAPGMVPLNIASMGVPYYTGNCHKWLCAPKGSAFLFIREDKRKDVRPLVISHGANSTRIDKSFLHLEFDWTGTDDYSPYILVGDCIDYLESLYPAASPSIWNATAGWQWRRRTSCARLSAPMSRVPKTCWGQWHQFRSSLSKNRRKCTQEELWMRFRKDCSTTTGSRSPSLPGSPRRGGWSESRLKRTTHCPTTERWHRRYQR
jgi:isopenicillin-N epimerase